MVQTPRERNSQSAEGLVGFESNGAEHL
jgi:hypothetical protein